MNKLIDQKSYPVTDVLSILLKDKSTKQNIIWATDDYIYRGEGYKDVDQMRESHFIGFNPIVLQPRISKTIEEQQYRTRKKAEVMTPVWLCNKMNNFADEEWFGRKNVFNVECSGNQWDVVDAKIGFPESKTWKDYVDSRRIEITCGEAPYLVSRYDTTTGEIIFPLFRRIGVLDRKLRIVNENTDNKEEWLKWAIRAIQSCYGYEYQGDNLLIARINVLITLCDYYKDCWQEKVDKKTLSKVANIIAWNLWQMDGLKDTVPLGKPYEDEYQISLFEPIDTEDVKEEREAVPCKIFNWRSKESIIFRGCKGRHIMSNKLFDFAIGNPPYQGTQNSLDSEGSLKNYAPPVYNDFIDAANEIADKVELIHPARFLFNAGSTPKAWNEKMLSDPNFKVLHYIEDATEIFPSTDIKGGIAITYHDSTREFGAIEVFTKYPELNEILKKVLNSECFQSIMDITYSRTAYRLNDVMHQEHPNALSKLSEGHAYDMASNIMERLPEVFLDEKPLDGEKYISIVGREKSKRVIKFIRKDYVSSPNNLMSYKVLVPQANGSGAFGETISSPIIQKPGVGNTETFISIGNFDSKTEAQNLLRYLSTKFLRAMLSVLKVTQNGNKPVWKYVPLQNFTLKSDINWNASIKNIDKQLYKKYGLSEEESAFIEANVKEME